MIKELIKHHELDQQPQEYLQIINVRINDDISNHNNTDIYKYPIYYILMQNMKK